MIRALPQGLPDLRFFRHPPSYSSAEGKPFGEKYLYKWWKRACTKLGIEGVDMYGGTRHTTACALRERYSPEQIKRATMHSTNAAFERYFRMDLEDIRSIYQDTKKGPVRFSEGVKQKGTVPVRFSSRSPKAKSSK